jgi:trehalose monomycolate/heme transporter
MNVRTAWGWLAAWIVATAGSVALALSTTAFPTDLLTLVSNLEAVRAERLVARHFLGEQNATVLYCVRDEAEDADAELAAEDDVLSLSQACTVNGATSGKSVASGVRTESTGFLSATPRTLILRGIDLARAQSTDPNQPASVQTLPVEDQLTDDLRRAELWSLVLTAAALLLTYRSLPAAFAAFSFGAVVVAVTWGGLRLASDAITVPFVVASIASLLALALGADLASLAYTAWRGGGKPTASTAAIACIGVAAVFVPLAVFPPSGLRAVAIGAAISAAVAFTGARTLIPAVTALLTRFGPSGRHEPGAGRIAFPGLVALAVRASSRLPVVAAPLAALLLLPLCVAGFAELSNPRSTLPVDPAAPFSTVRTALASDTERVVRGTIEFVIDAPKSLVTEAAIDSLLDEIARRPDFSAPVFVQWSSDEQLAVVTAFVTREDAVDAFRTAEEARDATPQLEDSTVIGGPVMLGAQVDDILQSWSLWGALGAAMMSFLVLTLGFRARLIPGAMVTGAAISALAALGAVSWAVEHGVAVGPFRVDPQEDMDPWAPLLVTCIVIAASTSYASLIIRQYRLRGSGDGIRTGAAFNRALAENPQLTSAAAVSMIAVGLGFTASGVPSLQQAGAGLAAALAIEASIVRAVLIPAALTLLDRLWAPKPVQVD